VLKRSTERILVFFANVKIPGMRDVGKAGDEAMKALS